MMEASCSHSLLQIHMKIPGLLLVQTKAHPQLRLLPTQNLDYNSGPTQIRSHLDINKQKKYMQTH